MSTEGHRKAMASPIARKELHRISDSAFGYLPREQARCCSGNCNQGRACPTRQACELPVDDDMTPTAKALVIAASLAVALMALAAAVLPMIFN